MATSRHIVHRRVADAYIETLTAKAKALPVGDPLNEGTALGPLINAKQRDRVYRIVTESVNQGARLCTGGQYEKLFYHRLCSRTCSQPCRHSMRRSLVRWRQS